MPRQLSFFISALIVLFLAMTLNSAAQGRFEGDMVGVWLDNGRDMKLERELTYVDGKGRRWSVPKNVVVNGASIPRFLWSFVGGPFTGKYRKASVIHDHFCVIRTRPSSEVHKVFLEASMASGLDKPTAEIMYLAVKTFGPSWGANELRDPSCERITEKNLDECVENSAGPNANVARQPSKDELRDFLKTVEKSGYQSQADKMRKSLGIR